MSKKRKRNFSSAPNPTSDSLWLHGIHPVMEALKNPQRQVFRLVCTEESAQNFNNINLPTKLEILSRKEITAILGEESVHQGVGAKVSPLPPYDITELIIDTQTDQTALVIVLDQITDPHNAGAILRSAAAFGAKAVITQERHSPPLNSSTLAKSACGALDIVPIIEVINLSRCLEQLKEAGFWCIGLAGEAETVLSDIKLDTKTALVMGAEGPGMRRLTKENCDILAKLPTNDAMPSLNVSVAAGIALYEVAKSLKKA